MVEDQMKIETERLKLKKKEDKKLKKEQELILNKGKEPVRPKIGFSLTADL
mgnify:FL=1